MLTGLTTRRLLLSASALAGLAIPAAARTVRGELPWTVNEAYPPDAVEPGPWHVLTLDEAATLEAIADRIIPPDEFGLGGREAGCAVFIDRQLAGPYGDASWLYMQGPFVRGLPTQGFQSADAPLATYRKGLAALAAHCQAREGGRPFEALPAERQNALLGEMEKGALPLDGVDARGFFEQLLTNTMEGYFADPIYGGNRDMTGWKLVAFPGVRYDYREVLDRPNQAYTLPPVGLRGRPEWSR